VGAINPNETMDGYHTEVMDGSPNPAVLQIESLVGPHEGERILKVHGPLVISNFFEFQQTAREDKSALLILDLAGVPYMDSAALGSVLAVHVSCGRKQTKYALINVAPRIETMLNISGVRDVIVMFPTLADAEAALL
jgi:anti-anti-sigma factor